MSIRWQTCTLLLLLMATVAFGQQIATAPGASQGATAPPGGQRGGRPINEDYKCWVQAIDLCCRGLWRRTCTRCASGLGIAAYARAG